MSQLLEPYTLRQLTLLNRIAVSPMCLSADGATTPLPRATVGEAA